MHIFYQPDIAIGQNILDEEESAHCCLSLRHKVGDTIHIADGKGRLYKARVTKAHGKKCEFGDAELLKEQAMPPSWVHLAIAPTKNTDRMEWMVEKLCELGVNEISFVQCNHSERKVQKTDRLDKKAISALKQSKNLYKTAIGELMPFEAFVKQIGTSKHFKAMAVVGEGLGHLYDLLPATSAGAIILVGPEGDFSPSEVALAAQQGFVQVSLGESVLRTETAGLIACHTSQLKLRKL